MMLYKDAKTLFADIETRFGGNEATKKTQKTLLKQLYRNFSAISTESLDSIFNKVQKIVCQVVVLGKKFDLDTMTNDDLYNNFKIVEQEVKGTACSDSSSQNMAFMTSPITNSTNEVPTAYRVSTASTLSCITSIKVSTANLSDATVYAFLSNQSNRSQLVYEDLEQIHKDDLEEMDLKWQLALLSIREKRRWNQDSSKRSANVEETPPKAMVAIDGVGFDGSYMTKDKVPTNMALMAFLDSEGVGFESYNAVPPPPTGLFSPPKINLSYSGLEEFQQPEFQSYRPKSCETESKNTSKEIPNKLKESPVAPLVKNRVLEKRDCTVESPVVANCNYHHTERVESRNNFTRVTYNNSTRKSHPNAHRNNAPRAVLMKTSLRPLNTARPVNIAHPKTIVHYARPMLRFSKSAQSTVKRPYQQRTTFTNKTFRPRPVNTARPRLVNTVRTRPVNIVRPRPVNTTRPISIVVNAVRTNKVNAVKASACWVWRPTKPNDASITLKRHNNIDGHPQQISRNSIEDMLPFEGGANGFRITGKETVHTTTKDETSGILKKFITEIENLVDKKVKVIRCDNGTKFKNTVMNDFCAIKADCKLPTTFWAKAVNTACYVQNRVLVVKPHNKTAYELFRGKLDGKAGEGYFVRYSMHSKAFRVYNIRTRRVEENLHIEFLENKPIVVGASPKWLFDIDMLTESMNYVPVIAGTNSNVFVGIEEHIGQGNSSKET
nr:hypothetical protein [Tanacetum cinerariifolium]